MGLITLGFLVCLSTLMFCAQGEDSPDFLKSLNKKLKPVQGTIGLWGIVWGILSLFVSLVSLINHPTFFIKLIASGFVLLLALPFGLGKLTSYFKMDNPVFQENINDGAKKIEKYGKYLSIAGFVVSVLLFVVIFE